MGIMNRVMRLCKADIHGVMDQLEDKGLLLKQCLRDMEAELGRKEARLRKMETSRGQAQRDHERCTKECERLDQDIESAIEKDEDDIARLLIKKLKPLAYYCDELDRHIQTVEREIIGSQEALKEQRLQYKQLQLRSKEYFYQVERDESEKSICVRTPLPIAGEATEGEVELELLKRKEATKGGAKK